MKIGQRIALNTEVAAFGHVAKAGEQGSVTGIHTDGYLTVRMTDGRPQFPHRDEVDVLPDPE